MRERVHRTRLWWARWKWYERNSLPWNRLAIHREMARREAFVRWPIHGNVLEALREGRLQIGAGTFLNMGAMIAAQELVEIGDHCMLANGCFVSDSSHRYDDPTKPITWQ